MRYRKQIVENVCFTRLKDEMGENEKPARNEHDDDDADDTTWSPGSRLAAKKKFFLLFVLFLSLFWISQFRGNIKIYEGETLSHIQTKTEKKKKSAVRFVPGCFPE